MHSRLNAATELMRTRVSWPSHASIYAAVVYLNEDAEAAASTMRAWLEIVATGRPRILTWLRFRVFIDSRRLIALRLDLRGRSAAIPSIHAVSFQPGNLMRRP